MSKQKTAERKFQAQRRLVRGGTSIKSSSKNQYILAGNPISQSGGFFSGVKNMLQTVQTYVSPTKSEIKSKLPRPQMNPSSLLISALLSFLPASSAQVTPPIGSMKFFSINGSDNYAILPQGSIGWIEGNCGIEIMPSGMAGAEIMSICTAGEGLLTSGWSKIYAGLNTSANMTAGLKCLQDLGQQRCDDMGEKLFIIACSILVPAGLCIMGCGLYQYLRSSPAQQIEEQVLEPGAGEAQAHGYQQNFQGDYHQLAEQSRAEGQPPLAPGPDDSEEEEAEVTDQGEEGIEMRSGR